jgi:hypothetical protein
MFSLYELCVCVCVCVYVCVCARVLSGIGHCDELITRSEESYREWGAECDPGTSQRMSRSIRAVELREKEITILKYEC